MRDFKSTWRSWQQRSRHSAFWFRSAAVVLLAFGVLGFAVDGVSKLWGPKSSSESLVEGPLISIPVENGDEESGNPNPRSFGFEIDPEFVALPPTPDTNRRRAVEALEEARKKKDWSSLIEWNLRIGVMDLWSPYFVLASVAGLVWAIIAAQFAGFSRSQINLYLVAIILGIFSAMLTVIVLDVQTIRGFVEGETFASRMIYMVSGIGLREETAKILCFAPMLFFLRKRSEVEALVVGGMVGLGFAINENISYYQQGGVSAAFPRLMTANFLHLAMTALIARAAFRLMARPKRHWEEFVATFLAVVVFHGLYDAFLSVPELVAGFSLMYLVCIAAMAYYFCELLSRIGRVGRSLAFAPVAVLVIGMAVLIGSVYVFACWRLPPIIAAMLCGLPLFVMFPIVLMFIQRLRHY